MTVGTYRAAGPARARAVLAMILVSSLVAGLALQMSGARASESAGTVAFVSDRDGDPEIFTVSPDGNGNVPQQITTNATWDTDPAWSPDASKIAFSSNEDGDDDIYVMTATGEPVANLTDAGSGRDVQPDWSPDSSKIAFVRDGDVYVVEVSGGSAPVRLGRGTSPSWAPDGSRIAVIRRLQGIQDVYLINADGSGATPLTSGLEADSPDWSPDGSKIAVESTAGPSGDSRIVVLDAAGTAPDIELPGPGEDFTPSWSPDGSSLVFTNITLDADLVVATLDGTRRDLVTGSSYDFLPAWSPCPPGACPSPTPSETPTATPTEGPDDERVATRTSLTFQKSKRRIKVAGSVRPAHPGSSVRVILWKKKGGRWARVARKRPLLDDDSIYRTRFRRPARTRRCRLRARFPGDADHLPSRRTKRFRC